jgi:hypothetical protein
MKKNFKYSNETVMFKSEHKKNYTVLTNSLIQNKELSFLEVGIMAYLLSLPKGWVINKTQIQKESGFGNSQFTKAWNNLVDQGYINSIRIKGGFSYEVIETPIKLRDANIPQFQQMLRLTDVKNETLISTHNNKVHTNNKPELPESVNESLCGKDRFHSLRSLHDLSPAKLRGYNPLIKEEPSVSYENAFNTVMDLDLVLTIPKELD